MVITHNRQWRRAVVDNGSIPARWRALYDVITGHVGSMHPAWRGWRVARDGLLYDADGNAYSPGQIRAMPMQRRLAEELQRELDRTRRKSA